MADVYNAAFDGETAEVRRLIDRGGNVNYKTVRRRLARVRARLVAARARSSAEGTSCFSPRSQLRAQP